MSREEDDDFLKTNMDLKLNQIEVSYDSTISDMDHKEVLESDSVFYSQLLSDTSKDTCSLPRPQFRRYKPNRGVHHILNRRREGMPYYSSEDLQKEPENVSSGEVASKDSHKYVSLGEILEKEDKDFIVSSQGKGVSAKPKSFFTRVTTFMAILLVVMSLTYMYISPSDPPTTDLSIHNNLSLSKLYVPPQLTQSAKIKFEGLAQRFQLWSENTFVYIWNLISNLTQMHKLASVQYINLTALLEEDHLAYDGYQLFGHNDVGAEFKYKENVLVAPTMERYVETGQFEECHQELEAEEEDIEDVVEEDNSPGSAEQEHQSFVEDQTELEAEAIIPNSSETERVQEVDSSDIHSEIKLLIEEPVPVVISEVAETQFEPEVRESEVQGDVNSLAVIESTKAKEVFQNSELDALVDDSPHNSATVDNAHNGAAYKFLTKNVMAVLLLAVLLSSLLVVTTFTYVMRGKPSTPVMTKKFDYSPSEMSSFSSCSYDSKRGLTYSSEAQSEERKTGKNYKRESIASSDTSMSSTYYGSFTTNQKIFREHHGYADEDPLITPVRRSRRLMKQVTSV